MRRYIINLLGIVALLNTCLNIKAHAGTEISIAKKGIVITITNGFMGCFSIKNISYELDDKNIHINFDYTDYDPPYESEQHNPLVDSSLCLCNLRDPQTRGWYVVFPHVNVALEKVRSSPNTFYGKLNNIPDIEKYSSLKSNFSENVFDNLPKHEEIVFPVKYINGSLARYYYINLFCN